MQNKISVMHRLNSIFDTSVFLKPQYFEDMFFQKAMRFIR